MFAICLPLACNRLENYICVEFLHKGTFVVYGFMTMKILVILLQLLFLLFSHNFLNAEMYWSEVLIDYNYTIKINSFGIKNPALLYIFC